MPVKKISTGDKILRIVKTAAKITVGIFVAYAVVFSLTATIAIGMLAYAVITPVLEVRNLKTANPAITIYMRRQRTVLAAEQKPDSLKCSFVPLDSISPNLIRAVLAAEDDGFYYHPGFDINAIMHAIEYNKNVNGSRRHGASTITQQVAKNLFTGGERTFYRKYRELAYALLMEHILGKDRILELYMNYAQWGENIFGCEAASIEYFGKSSRNLSVSQAAHLAAILAKPSKLNPNSTSSVFLQKRLAVIANNMFRRHSIDTVTWKELGGSEDSASVADSAAPENAEELKGSEQKQASESSVPPVITEPAPVSPAL
jgi:monofunctional biosynthetic peptidoglycan transglycosylase